MIPLAYIQQWSVHAPWPELRQVEQDLIITRALCDLFSCEQLQDRIAFRGGTAINKLIFGTPLRYSEDIDLVQTKAQPIGPLIEGVRSCLAWLGKCSYDQAPHSTHLVFKFRPEAGAQSHLKLKIEINTREHESRFGLKRYPFQLNSDWHQAKVEILSFEPEELFGTKFRALLQRNKNRDLFDLNEGLIRAALDSDRIIQSFLHYINLEGNKITRANAEERMLKKLNRSLTEDIAPLLPAGIRFDEGDAAAAFGRIWAELVQKIPGESWKSTKSVIEALRKEKFPDLLEGILLRAN